MDHETEGDGQDDVEAPGNGAPVKQRVGAGPVLLGTHFQNMGFIGVEHPLAQGIEQDVRGQTCGEHHGAPAEGGILRFVRVAQADFAEAGKTHVQGADEGPQPQDQVIAAQLVAQEKADGTENTRRGLRQSHEQGAQHENA